MKHLYAIKGCSHCDIRESCNLKDSEANLSKTLRTLHNWETFCKDFFREHREKEV